MQRTALFAFILLLASCSVTENQTLEPFQLSMDSLTVVPADCTDSEVAHGYLLCVDDGVSVIDTRTMKTVAQTAEPVPLKYGIAAWNGFFATASVGCRPEPECCGLFGCFNCCDSNMDHSAGLRLYQIDDTGQPALASFLPLRGADNLAFYGALLFVVHETKLIQVFSVADPAHPVLMGCGTWEQEGPTLGLPLVDDERVVIFGPQMLVAFDRRSLLNGCDRVAPTQPVSEISVEFNGLIDGTAFLLDGYVYVVNSRGLQVFDFSNLQRPRRGVRLRVNARSAALIYDRIFVLEDARIIGYTITNREIPAAVDELDLGDLEPQRLGTDGQQLLLFL